MEIEDTSADAPVALEPFQYVIYLPDGTLNGCYIQVPPAAHADCLIVVDEALAAIWPAYRANEARDGVELLPPAPPPALTKADYTAFMQAALDDKAKERQYDGIMSLCTYATSKNPKFSNEGQAGVNWRDDMWSFGYNLMAKVESGKVPAPSLEELGAMLPTMAWPA